VRDRLLDIEPSRPPSFDAGALHALVPLYEKERLGLGLSSVGACESETLQLGELAKLAHELLVAAVPPGSANQSGHPGERGHGRERKSAGLEAAVTRAVRDSEDDPD